MDPNAPWTTGQFVQALWALAIGLVVPWVTIIPIWVAIERSRDRKASREAQARLQAWEAAHPREAPDEPARLAQLRDQLWLDSLTPHVRAHILRQRLEDAEREARARAILDAERRAARDGETRPQEGSHENRLLCFLRPAADRGRGGGRGAPAPGDLAATDAHVRSGRAGWTLAGLAAAEEDT
jgi:hypothetical protein